MEPPASSSRPPRVRVPSFADATALGACIEAGLHDAPSAPLEVDELGRDLEQLGTDFLSASVYGQESLLIAELHRHVVGLARLIPREFVRGSHIASLQLLVHPRFRRQGVGGSLLHYGLAEGFGPRRFERIELAVTDCDAALRALIDPAAWTCERIERAAFLIDGTFHDVAIWVLDRDRWPSSPAR